MTQTPPTSNKSQIDRPSMPPGYGIKPQSEGQGLLPWQFLSTRMEEAHNYWLVTASANGLPHAAPVWGLWHRDAFYFSTDPSSRKGRNIALGRQVVVHLESGDEVAIVEGHPERVQENELLDELDALYFRKYAFHLKGTPTYRVLPAKAFAWLEADFTGSATRWQLKT